MTRTAEQHPDLPMLSTSLGWTLATLLRHYQRQVEVALADLPGGSRGYLMLTAIANESCQSQVALAERLGLDRTTVTYLLDDLEKGGLIRRAPDPADRRIRHVSLTDEGSAALARLVGAVQQVETDVLSRLSGAEADHFNALLAKAAGTADSSADATEMCKAVVDVSAC